MQIKKSSLEALYNYTKGTEGVLDLKDSRVRDTFLKQLTEKTALFQQERNKIYTTFCKKDEEGKPALVDGTKYEFNTEDLETINKELQTLLDEEVTLELHGITKELLQQSGYKPMVGEAEIIDEVISKI